MKYLKKIFVISKDLVKIPKKVWYESLHLCCPCIVNFFIWCDKAKSKTDGINCIFPAISLKAGNWALSPIEKCKVITINRRYTKLGKLWKTW